MVKYRAARVLPPNAMTFGGRPESAMVDVLTRDSAVLMEAKGDFTEHGLEATPRNFRPASAEEREDFVNEVDAVVAAFNKAIAAQAVSYADSARKAVKLTPR
jgi:hypothetical protein